VKPPRERPGDQVVGSRRVGAFEKHIVIGIAGDRQAARRPDDVAAIFDELQQSQALASSHLDIGPLQDPCILFQDRQRHVEAGGLREGEKQGRALQPVGVERGRNQDVCVEYQPKRQHLPLLLFLRAVFLD
jgi:hypothetical protein